MKAKATIKIDGVEYTCEVKNGVRYVDGKTVDSFLESLQNPKTIVRLAQIGDQALKDEAEGRNDEFHNYQGELMAKEFIDENKTGTD
jgi:hypothetical protein